MKTWSKLGVMLLSLSALVGFSACKGSKESSSTTGWSYNDTKWGGFEKLDYEGQATPPNMVLIEGGTFTMGFTDQDVTYDWNNVPRRVTVQSFYMDETEISNLDYREYLHWIRRVYGESYPDVYQKALPDTMVWRDELSYNEPLVETYFRHPSYDLYPVVGVSWLQANDYSQWRSDRVNEGILVKRGILNNNNEQKDNDSFNTGAYLAGQYQGDVRKNMKDLVTGGERGVRFEDGIMLPSFRLPTEAEWEYAAQALQGNQASELDERYTDRRIYPWDGNTMRYQVRDKHQGMMLANYKRGSGDYMGIAGKLNDNAAPTAEVRSFLPNDFGLYNMAGNVNEWTADIYRAMTSIDLSDVENHDFNPYRGGEFKELILKEDGTPEEKDSLGRLQYRLIDSSKIANRDNFRRPTAFDYRDGDKESEAYYDYGASTLVSNKARVIKGGSWADRAYWLSPGTRRYKDEDKSDRTIGFRCAMVRVGAPSGNEGKGGNQFDVRGKKSSSARTRR